MVVAALAARLVVLVMAVTVAAAVAVVIEDQGWPAILKEK
jgi:hypothetical protein